MNSDSFCRLAKEAYSPFLTRLGFSAAQPQISGKLYDAEFVSRDYVVSICFEPGDSYFSIYVFRLVNGKRSDIDDLAETPRLTELRRRFMASVAPQERVQADVDFGGIVTTDAEEEEMLRGARDLSLLLPKYLAASRP